jgi:hypothetical protein
VDNKRSIVGSENNLYEELRVNKDILFLETYNGLWVEPRMQKKGRK